MRAIRRNSTLLDPVTGACRSVVLGPDAAGAMSPMPSFRRGPGRAPAFARVAGAGWALFGCTVAPAWDERDFELGRRADLLRDFPAHAASITALTR